MNIPNRITLSRIILMLLLFVTLMILDFLPSHYFALMLGDSGINVVYFVTFIVFVIAASTDYFDGHLARKWHQVSDLGKFLDPVADKLLVDVMLIYLVVPHFGLSSQLSIPLFAVIIMVARDLVIDALRAIAASKGKVLAANMWGKAKTVLQMIAIPLVLLNGWPFSYFDSSWPTYLHITDFFVYAATLVSLLSMIVYLWQNRTVFQEKKGDA